MNGVRVAVFAAAMVMGTAAVQADPSTGSGAPQEAKTAYEEGNRLFESGDYVAAATAYRRAMRLAPTWRLYYNIAQAEAAAKRYGLALEAFQLYLAQGGDEVPDERQQEVFANIEALKKKTGEIKIVAPPGSLVTIDGVERGTTPLPGTLLVAAGVPHEVVVSHGGEEVGRRTLRVWVGEEEVAEFLPQPEEPVVEEPDTAGATADTDAAAAAADVGPADREDAVSPPADSNDASVGASDAAAPHQGPDEPADQAPVDAHKSGDGGATEGGATKKGGEGGVSPSAPAVVQTVEQRHPLRIVGGVVTALGAATLVAAGITGTMAIVKKKQLADRCVNNLCPNDGTLGAAWSWAKATNVVLPVGAALFTTGVVLTVVGRRVERKRLLVTAAPAPGGGVAVASWRW